jgi:hypothetical protein
VLAYSVADVLRRSDEGRGDLESRVSTFKSVKVNREQLDSKVLTRNFKTNHESQNIHIQPSQRAPTWDCSFYVWLFQNVHGLLRLQITHCGMPKLSSLYLKLNSRSRRENEASLISTALRSCLAIVQEASL